MNSRIFQLAASLLITAAGVSQAQDSLLQPLGGPLARPDRQVHHCHPGPWGDLEYYPIMLEAPDAIAETIPLPSGQTTWSLPGMSITEIRELLASAGLREEWIVEILDASLPHHSSPPYRLYPPTHIVEGMSRESRTVLYASLRPWSENRFYHSPVIIESGDTHEWFQGSGLSPETIDRIDRMTYRIGNAAAFSDVSAILTRINTDWEERALLKALTRTRSLILRLRISQESDRVALRDYWTVGLKNKDVLPYFESITRTPGVDHIDLIHLLPPTPRKYLNTFPTLALGVEGTFPGSFWTALNFFRFHPLDDFNDTAFASAHAQENFALAEKPYRFGDLFLIKDIDTNRAIHVCIYIADDIVYTKNGRSLMQPFMLMKIDDLLARYSVATNPAVIVWRLKSS